MRFIDITSIARKFSNIKASYVLKITNSINLIDLNVYEISNTILQLDTVDGSGTGSVSSVYN